MSKNNKNWSYLAGFLDGDGSIYVRIKPNKSYRFGFQIAPTVAFFQSQKEEEKLRLLQKDFGIGYLRKRNDGIVEWVIGDEEGIKTIIQNTISFLRLKSKQARLMLEILKMKPKVKDKKDFVILAEKVELFRNLNYSKKRKKRIY